VRELSLINIITITIVKGELIVPGTDNLEKRRLKHCRRLIIKLLFIQSNGIKSFRGRLVMFRKTTREEC